MRPTVKIKSLVSATAFIVLAAVLLASAVALNDAQISSTQSEDEPPATASGALEAELARFKAIGAEAANAPICKLVREDNRKRFLESGNHRENPIDSFSAAPDWRPPISFSPAEAPKGPPHSSATPDANPSPRSGDSPGARAK
jgi:conjugative transfer region protein TrbK